MIDNGIINYRYCKLNKYTCRTVMLMSSTTWSKAELFIYLVILFFCPVDYIKTSQQWVWADLIRFGRLTSCALKEACNSLP